MCGCVFCVCVLCVCFWCVFACYWFDQLVAVRVQLAGGL